MATPNPDSSSNSLPVTVTFTSGNGCIPPAVLEALQSASWRLTLPSASATSVTGATISISTLAGNIARLDITDALYVPGIAKVELAQQTVTLTSQTAPGTPVDMVFTAASVADLQNSILNIFFTIEPPEAPVYIGPPVYSNGQIRYSIYRTETDDTPPYDEIVVRGDGRIFIVPSPA